MISRLLLGFSFPGRRKNKRCSRSTTTTILEVLKIAIFIACHISRYFAAKYFGHTFTDQ